MRALHWEITVAFPLMCLYLGLESRENASDKTSFCVITITTKSWYLVVYFVSSVSHNHSYK